jgi:hypothetical protein
MLAREDRYYRIPERYVYGCRITEDFFGFAEIAAGPYYRIDTEKRLKGKNIGTLIIKSLLTSSTSHRPLTKRGIIPLFGKEGLGEISQY